MKLTKTSLYTQKTNTMELPLTEEEFQEAHKKWKSGTLIQYAFPTLTPDQREFIMTGLTQAEWNELFPEEEEEDA